MCGEWHNSDRVTNPELVFDFVRRLSLFSIPLRQAVLQRVKQCALEISREHLPEAAFDTEFFLNTIRLCVEILSSSEARVPDHRAWSPFRLFSMPRCQSAYSHMIDLHGVNLPISLGILQATWKNRLI